MILHSIINELEIFQTAQAQNNFENIKKDDILKRNIVPVITNPQAFLKSGDNPYYTSQDLGVLSAPPSEPIRQ